MLIKVMKKIIYPKILQHTVIIVKGNYIRDKIKIRNWMCDDKKERKNETVPKRAQIK